MQIDGVWATDILGYLGWERTGITFLDDGKIHGGSAEFYHHGKYLVDGENVKMTLHLTSHGNRKHAYGKKRNNFTIRMKGKWNGEKIEGKAMLVGAKSDDVEYNFRLVRLSDLATFSD
jgi:hypothetical protein